MSSIIELLDPVRHLRTHLEQGVRLDGRSYLELRDLSIDCQGGEASLLTKAAENCYGYAEVHLGATIVLCNITLQIGTPSPLAPDEGDLDFDVSLTGICDPKYESFRTKHDDALDLESLLSCVFIEGRIVDLKCLGIATAEYAFRLCVGVTVLSHDGNIQDAAILAVMSALHDTKLPDAVFPSELPQDKRTTVKHGKFGCTKNFPCITAKGNPKKPVCLLARALPLTVAVFLNAEKEWDLRQASLLIDPARNEERVMHCTITTVLRISSPQDNAEPMDGSSVNPEFCGIFCNESDDIGSSDPRCRGGTPNDYFPSVEDAPSSTNGGIVPAAVELCVAHAKSAMVSNVPFL